MSKFAFIGTKRDSVRCSSDLNCPFVWQDWCVDRGCAGTSNAAVGARCGGGLYKIPGVCEPCSAVVVSGTLAAIEYSVIMQPVLGLPIFFGPERKMAR